MGIYQPLQRRHIRLLDFIDDLGLGCTLEDADLDHAPSYAALSYTWGKASYQKGRPPEQVYEVTINGETIQTQQNLHDAFRHLSKHVRSRSCRFWVDFVCINQQDVAERSLQVQYMAEIYQKAEVIYAWLGVPFDEEETKMAVKLMREFNQFLREGLERHGGDLRPVTASMNTDSVGFPTESRPDPISAWDGIAEMFNQHYWQRTWVYQEATTPREIWFWCGDHCFNDIHLSATVYFGYEYSRFPEFSPRFVSAAGPNGSAWAMSVARTARQTYLKTGGQTMLQLVKQVRKARCTDPRDKIFAPRGHAVGVGAEDFVVDYERSLRDVYTELVRFSLFSEPRGYSILGYVYSPAPEAKHEDLRGGTLKDELPSWVPDWRMRVDITPFQHTPGPHDETLLYDASAGKQQSVKIDGSQMKVDGFSFDSIDAVFDIWEDDENRFDTPRAWRDRVQAHRPEISDDAIDRTLVADLRGEPRRKGGDLRTPDYQRIRGGRMDWSLTSGPTIHDSAATEWRRKQDFMVRLLKAACFGRRMGVLRRNYAGMFPAAAMAGDRVAIFHGGNVPFVVREVPGGEVEYQLIGECYLDGLMDGQAVEVIRKSGINEATITLV